MRGFCATSDPRTFHVLVIVNHLHLLIRHTRPVNPIFFANSAVDMQPRRAECSISNPTPSPLTHPCYSLQAFTALTSSSFFRISGSGPTGVMLNGLICL